MPNTIDCEPPKGTLSEAKSSRRGRAYRSREDLYSDKIAIGEKKVCPFFAPKPQAQYWNVFDENSIFLFNYIEIFFGRNLLYNYFNNDQKLFLIIIS